jgi:DNA polymerase III delta subunit
MSSSVVEHLELIINKAYPENNTIKIKKELNTGTTEFYVYIGTDILIIEESILSLSIKINKEKILVITEVTPGEYYMIGQAWTEL